MHFGRANGIEAAHCLHFKNIQIDKKFKQEGLHFIYINKFSFMTRCNIREPTKSLRP